MQIREDDLSGPEVAELLNSHLRTMATVTQPDRIFALDLEALRAKDITFWTVWDDGDLLGCGALREISSGEGEVKSMHTAHEHRRRGVGQFVLDHIMDVAGTRGYLRLFLETGSQGAFAPARGLYLKNGFRRCGPFGDYPDLDTSTFMVKDL